MPLIKNFQSTHQWKAFTLNSINAALTVVMAITTKQYLDNFKFYNQTLVDKKNKSLKSRTTSIANVIITLLVTFCTSMLVYLFMYLIFGFGAGMLSVTN